ncbi:UDP-N-acetylmuramate--L-alanine ligase [Planctomicrobium sp. SH661]|uniref:UDP-N-acetylmuramate--L-alanine ligase n=1 Tax=Planctomicrobium sp. SH661 TaxID=3448124 RepID=UPI003F5B4C9D
MSSPSLWLPASTGSRAHLVGICGAGMKALAEYLIDRGWQVSGCDGDPDPGVVQVLARNGVSVQTGHSPHHLQNRPDVLIYSAAVRPENSERTLAAQWGIPQFSYVEALAQLTQSSHAVAIAGTHGKSTTTAMLGQILESAGVSPSVICGAESVSLGRSGWGGTGSTLVVEACEFRRHFLQLHPRIACLLGIEPDHFDCYPTLADAEAAYAGLAGNVAREQGTLIARSDCPVTLRVLETTSAPRITFSLSDVAADWQVIDRQSVPRGNRFRLQNRDRTSRVITLQVPGRHNIQNALAAAACADALGLSMEQIASGLEAFQGLRRRFEVLGTRYVAQVVDDYAHHPTEIRATLEAAREAFPGKSLICIFQPHQISRTSALLGEFAQSLSLADRVYLLPVYAARENSGEVQAELSRELVRRLTVPGAFLMALDQVWGTVQTEAGNDAVILTLGAGSLSRIHHEDLE